MSVSLMLMELSIVALILGWVWVVIAGSSWPAPWAVLLAGPVALMAGKTVPYAWRRLGWFDGVWWASMAILVALLAELGNVLAPGASSASRWNVQFVAGLLVAWRAWALAEGWIDRELVESELQVGTLVVLVMLLMLIWVVPGAGLVPAVAFAACGLVGLGLARRAERRDPRASLESDWLVLVAALVVAIVVVAVVVVALVTPDVLLAMFEQVKLVAMLALGGIAAVFAWLGSFLPGAGTVPQQLPSSGLGGPLLAGSPTPPSSTTVAVPPSWVFELLMTFVLAVFLVLAGRAIFRLMKQNLRPIAFSLPRQREPAPPVSTADQFTWGGWWQLVVRWLRGWLASPRTATSQAAGASTAASQQVAEQRSIRALYRELLTATARAGFARQPSTTPNELAREVNEARPAASRAMTAATELYVRTRYGEEQVGRDDLARMKTAVQQARKDLTPPPVEPRQSR